MNLTWTDIAWGQYEEWQRQDKKIVKKINEIIKDIKRNGNEGCILYIFDAADDRISVNPSGPPITQ